MRRAGDSPGAPPSDPSPFPSLLLPRRPPPSRVFLPRDTRLTKASPAPSHAVSSSQTTTAEAKKYGYGGHGYKYKDPKHGYYPTPMPTYGYKHKDPKHEHYPYYPTPTPTYGYKYKYGPP